MARKVRIQFAGAIYHCSARGNRGVPIVNDAADRDAFVALLPELVERTGFEIYAWVLMEDHYHLVFKTPEPTLVDGMKWLQNIWTKQFNARHLLSGNVFGDRYKAVLVEEGEHLGTLIDYVHLNPFRAGMVKPKNGLGSYRWSSLADYLATPRLRSGWVEVAQGLSQTGYPDDSAPQRRRYLKHLEKVAREHHGIPELPGTTEEERTLQSTLRRGWYFGTEEFRDQLNKRLEQLQSRRANTLARRSGFTGAPARAHGETEAKRLVKRGLNLAGLKKRDLSHLKKGDWRKRFIGRKVRRSTVMPVTWIAETLQMGDPIRAANLVQSDPNPTWGKEWKLARKLLAALDKAK